MSPDPPMNDETVTDEQEPTDRPDSETTTAADVSGMTESKADSSVTPDGNDSRFADVIQSIPWAPSVLAGAGSFLIGYVLTAALFYIGPASLSAGSEPARLRGIGVIFYNSHFVDGIEILSAGGLEETVRFNLILEQSSTAVPSVVYFAIPVAALLAVGAVVGYVILDADVEYVTVGLVGVAMALGYVSLTVAGTFIAEVTVGWELGPLLLEPDQLQAVALGFAYPFVLGTVGALLGHLSDH